jgi:hypothetical protein
MGEVNNLRAHSAGIRRNPTTKRMMTFWLPAIILAFSPAVALADAGTPLMWASAVHLLFGKLSSRRDL